MNVSTIYHCRVTSKVEGIRVEETFAFQSEPERHAFNIEAGRRGWLVVSNWQEPLHDVDSAVTKMLKALLTA